MNGCQTCGGFGMHHDPMAHGWARNEDDHPDVCGNCGGSGWEPSGAEYAGHIEWVGCHWCDGGQS